MKREAKSSASSVFTVPKIHPKPAPFLPLIPLLLICLFLLRPLYHQWFPRVTDGEYYLARLGSFFVSMEQGQIFPRWAPTFKFGFGYPVFNFNYPLPNYIGALFMFLGFTAQTSMKFIFSGSLVAAALGMYLYLLNKFGKTAAFTGSFLYITAPYFTYDMFLRGTYGELVALAIFPFTLLFIEKYLKKQTTQNFIGLVIFSASIFLAHNIMALFSLVLIFFYLLLNYSPVHLKSLIYPLTLTFLLISFFWIPALYETRYTVMGERDLYQSFLTKLRPMSELTKLPPFFPEKASLEHMRQIGYAQIFTLFISALYFFKTKSKSIFGITFFTISFISIFLITKQSAPFWELLPMAKTLQHPFRLLFVTVISTAILSAWLISTTKSKLLPAALIILTFITYYLFYTTPTDYILYEDSFLKNYPLTSTAADEFDPPWYNKEISDQFLDGSQEHFVVATGSAKIASGSKTNQFKYHLFVDTDEPIVIVEKTLYFPGWEVYIDSRKINIDQNKNNYGGLINYAVPIGAHNILTKFSQNTPSRIIGNTLTVLGIILFTIKVIYLSDKPLNKKH